LGTKSLLINGGAKLHCVSGRPGDKINTQLATVFAPPKLFPATGIRARACRCPAKLQSPAVRDTHLPQITNHSTFVGLFPTSLNIVYFSTEKSTRQDATKKVDVCDSEIIRLKQVFG
jgi:hypothetical protein